MFIYSYYHYTSLFLVTSLCWPWWNHDRSSVAKIPTGRCKRRRSCCGAWACRRWSQPWLRIMGVVSSLEWCQPQTVVSLGRYHWSIRWNDYWRSTPGKNKKNKAWFMNPGLTLTKNWGGKLSDKEIHSWKLHAKLQSERELMIFTIKNRKFPATRWI